MFPTKKQSQRELRNQQNQIEDGSGSGSSALERMLGAFTRAVSQGPATTGSGLQFVPGQLLRTDGLPVDDTLAALRKQSVSESIAADQLRQIHAIHERSSSMSDITPDLYQAFSANAASIMNWFPALAQAVHETGSALKLPATSIWRMPHELAQYLRLEYTDTTGVSREVFNSLVAQALGLDTTAVGTDPETGAAVTAAYFLKTGQFSSKFEFANARCTEAHEAGEYFHVISNIAMSLGAGHSVDLCARQYIEPKAGTPTIYNGMPLRTELRAFVDLGQDLGSQLKEDTESGATAPVPEILGIVPYWHPTVMDKALAHHAALGIADMQRDYKTWLEHGDAVLAGFGQYRDQVLDHLQELVPALRAAGLRGAWSVDIMVNETGDPDSPADLYVIDMALMATSALADLLKVTEEYSTVSPARLDQLTGEYVWTHITQALYTPPPGTAGTIPGIAHWNGVSSTHTEPDAQTTQWPEIPGSVVDTEQPAQIWSGPSMAYRYHWGG